MERKYILVSNRGPDLVLGTLQHVAKVISVDSAAGTMVVEEMNGSRKFVVQRRTDKLNNANIKGYIYMPATPWKPN